MILAEAEAIPHEALAAVAILFLLTLWVMVRTHRKTQARSEVPAPLPSSGTDPEMRNAMRELLLQMEETHRKISASIDTRLKLLTQLVVEADRRIELLKAATAAAPRARPAPEEPAEDPQTAEIYRMS